MASSKCGKCKKQVSKNEDGFFCEYCSIWCHNKFQNILLEEYAFLCSKSSQVGTLVLYKLWSKGLGCHKTIIGATAMQ